MKPLGKPLPPVKEIAAPSEQEIDKVVALWNANCPLYYIGLMEAEPVTNTQAKSRFLYDKVSMKFIHRKTKRVLTQKEINQAFIDFNNKMAAK